MKGTLAAVLVSAALAAQTGSIPPGFTRIFNGSDLAGWHISEVNHHGNTRGWTVENGVLLATQDKPGNGGIILTDRKYKDFEVYLEMRPDFGCDSGLFLRSTEKGEAYQVLMDYLEGGAIAGIYGEGLKDVKPPRPQGWREAWKKDDWNALRARIEGNPPHITVWLNGTQTIDWTDTANHSIDGATDGMIALQVHGGKRWVEGGYHRFRNVAIKELK